MHRILLLPGDGIGPEVSAEARRVLEAAASGAGLALAFDEELIGGASIDARGTPLSDGAVERARDCRALLLGAHEGCHLHGGARREPLALGGQRGGPAVDAHGAPGEEAARLSPGEPQRLGQEEVETPGRVPFGHPERSRSGGHASSLTVVRSCYLVPGPPKRSARRRSGRARPYKPGEMEP